MPIQIATLLLEMFEINEGDFIIKSFKRRFLISIIKNLNCLPNSPHMHVKHTTRVVLLMDATILIVAAAADIAASVFALVLLLEEEMVS